MIEGSATTPSRGERALPTAWLSLRTRLTLWVVAIFSSIQIATTGVYWLYQSALIDRRYEDLLAERTDRLVESITEAPPGLRDQELRARALEQFQGSRLGAIRVGLFHPDGSSVEDASPMDGPPPGLDWERARLAEGLDIQRVPLAVIEEPDPASQSARAVTERFLGGDGAEYVLVLVSGDGPAVQEKRSVGQSLLLATAVGPVAAGVAGWFIAGIAVAPFQQLREAAQHLRPESLGMQIEVEHSGTEIETLTRDLEESRRRMEAAFATQDRFLSNVSHEIKTPIAVLLVEAQTLDRRDFPKAAVDFIRSAEQEMLRLGRMVESFLTLSRIKDGKGRTRDLACSANDVVMESIQGCQLMAEQHGAKLRPVLLDGDGDADTQVHGDPDLLGTMLDNLVRNAIRFTPRGEAVEVRLSRDADRVTFEVADRGPGVPPDRIATYFDRFVQAPEEQRKGRGHGLGLAIAQGIAELHGGLISVADRPGGGCVFAISLPATRPSVGGAAIAGEGAGARLLGAFRRDR